jgi:hypothetical protein
MKEKVNMELIQNGTGTGAVSSRLLQSNMDPGILKPFIGDDGMSYQTAIINGKAKAVPILNTATLRKDEWKQMDDAILFAAQERLIGVADLYSRGLVYNIGNGLGKTVLEYEDLNEMTAAEITMDAVTPTQKDRPQYDLKYLPLPIIHKDFSFNIRALNASRTTGTPLDVVAGMQAARQVSEKVEDILFNGASTYTYGGGTIYGYTDHPNKSSVTLSTQWDASAATGTTILDDVRAMKQAAIDAKHYGPYVLYIPTNYETTLDDDFKSESDKTIRQRILEISGIQDVKVADKLTDDTVVLVQMTSDVVRMVEGLAMQTVEWQEGGGFTTNYKVLTIMVPQIRADQNGNSGIVVLSA